MAKKKEVKSVPITLSLSTAEVDALKKALEIGSAGLVESSFKETLKSIAQKL